MFHGFRAEEDDFGDGGKNHLLYKHISFFYFLSKMIFSSVPKIIFDIKRTLYQCIWHSAICQCFYCENFVNVVTTCYYSRVVILFGKFIIFFIKWQFGGTDKVTNCYFSYSLSAVGSHFRKNRRTNLKNQRFFSKFVRAPNLWNKFVCNVFYILESQYDFPNI